MMHNYYSFSSMVEKSNTGTKYLAQLNSRLRSKNRLENLGGCNKTIFKHKQKLRQQGILIF